MRKRLVIGLREVLKLASVGRLKAVVVAPDIDYVPIEGLIVSLSGTTMVLKLILPAFVKVP